MPWEGRSGRLPLLQWGHSGFGGGVECCGDEAVSDLPLLTLPAVAFTGEKEMPLNSDVA